MKLLFSENSSSRSTYIHEVIPRNFSLWWSRIASSTDTFTDKSHLKVTGGTAGLFSTYNFNNCIKCSYVHTYMYACICLSIYIHTCMCTRIHTHTHTLMNIFRVIFSCQHLNSMHFVHSHKLVTVVQSLENSWRGGRCFVYKRNILILLVMHMKSFSYSIYFLSMMR